VVGVSHGKNAKAYDWNALKKMRVINDTIGTQRIALVLLPDDKSFFAVQRNSETPLTLHHDTLVVDTAGYPPAYLMDPNSPSRLPANQVFWHTWRTFHPNSTKYQ
jgi:hypothetical protein